MWILFDTVKYTTSLQTSSHVFFLLFFCCCSFHCDLGTLQKYDCSFSREPSKWQTGDIEHLGRLVFSLSTKQMNSIPAVSTHQKKTKYTAIIYFILQHGCPKWVLLNIIPLFRKSWIKTPWNRFSWVKSAGRRARWVSSVWSGAWTNVVSERRPKVS